MENKTLPYIKLKKIDNSIKKGLIFSTLLSGQYLMYNSINATSYAEDVVYTEEAINNLVSQAELLKSEHYKDLAQNAIDTLGEGDFKNSLQERIDSIDTTSLIYSGNIDVYIKPQNILSLSLDTNTVIFEDYSGIESLERLGALELSVDSTLPYDLNSYLESEISNADGTKFLDRKVLNLKESSSNDYKYFLNLNEKVTLLADCESGYNKRHSIDMKLNASVFETDIYKTVVKFEIEQK